MERRILNRDQMDEWKQDNLERAVRKAIPWLEIGVDFRVIDDEYHGKHLELWWGPNPGSFHPYNPPHHDTGYVFPNALAGQKVFDGFEPESMTRLMDHRDEILDAAGSLLAVSVPTVWLPVESGESEIPEVDRTTDTDDDDDEAPRWCKIEDQTAVANDWLTELRAKVIHWGSLVTAAQYDHPVLHWLKSAGLDTIVMELSRVSYEVGVLAGMGGPNLNSALDEIMDEISETMTVEPLEKSPYLHCR